MGLTTLELETDGMLVALDVDDVLELEPPDDSINEVEKETVLLPKGTDVKL